MGYSDLITRTWEENILFSALLELTYRCNLDCFICYNDRELSGRALSFEQYVALLEDLAGMGVMHLTLSGGEPLAHPHFFQIGAKARALGFAVRIKSNGHALRATLARRIREEIDPAMIETSIHGSRAETHERQTRVPGSFDRLMNNLREMRALGLRFELNCPVTRWNESELSQIDALGSSLDVRVKFDSHITPRDNGDQGPLSIRPTDTGIREVFSIASGRIATARQAAGMSGVVRSTGAAPAASTAKHCGAGSSTLTVDPVGNVYPCVQWRRRVGNLHRLSISEIWTRSRELDLVRNEAKQVKETLNSLATAKSALSFCPGAAWQETGNAKKLYDTARRRLAIALKD